MNLRNIARKTGAQIVQKSPAILTGIGCAGVISTVIFAVRATPKAQLVVDRLKEEHDGDPIPKGELIKNVAPIYIPTGLMVCVTIGCIIGANRISSKRNAVLASLYSASELALGDADFEGFGTGVKAFGDGIRAFRDAILGLAAEKDTGTMDEDIEAALALGTQLNTYISGLKPIKDDLRNSVGSIGDFGDAIGKVRTEIGGINGNDDGKSLKADVDTAVDIAQKIFGFFNEVYRAYAPSEESGSYTEILINARGALDTVIPNIEAFGDSIQKYGEAINGIATTTISADTDKALENAGSLAIFFAGLSTLDIEKDHGFLVGLFADDTKAESFLTYTENFGEAVANLNTSIHDLATSTITEDSTAALTVAQEIANLERTPSRLFWTRMRAFVRSLM